MRKAFGLNAYPFFGNWAFAIIAKKLKVERLNLRKEGAKSCQVLTDFVMENFDLIRWSTVVLSVKHTKVTNSSLRIYFGSVAKPVGCSAMLSLISNVLSFSESFFHNHTVSVCGNGSDDTTSNCRRDQRYRRRRRRTEDAAISFVGGW